MNELVTVLVLGLVTGLQAAMLAVGLVLIYKVQRFINFAQASSGIVAASVLGVLVLRFDLPYGIAAVLALVVGIVVSVLVERLLAWRLGDASPTTQVIATIGASQLLLIPVATGPLSIEPSQVATVGYPLPFHASLDVGGYTMNAGEITTVVVAPLLVGALQLFVTRTRTGSAIRGVASNRDAALLSGISVRRIRTLVWAIAGAVSAIAAVLFAPSQPAGTLASAGTGLLLLGVAAALAAGLADLRLAFVAGLAVGIAQQACLFWIDIPGVADLAVFAFVMLGLAVRSGPIPLRDQRGPVPGAAVRGSLGLRGRAGWMGLFAALLLLPLLPGLDTQEKALLLTLIVVYAIAGQSLLVMTGWAGQVSMGHFALVGVGAFATARFTESGLSAPIVLINTAIVTAFVTVLVGLPALRLGRLFTAISTLAFAFVAQSWLFRQSWFTGNDTGYMLVERIDVLGTEIHTARGVYVLSVVVLACVTLLLRTVRASSLGRSIIAVRDNPDLAAAQGLSPLAVRLTGLALSGAIVGLAGSLWAMASRQFTFDSFDPTMSLVLLAAAIVGSLGLLHGPILGAFAVFVWPYLVPDANTIVIRSLTSGALLLIVLVAAPHGLAGTIRDHVLRRWPARTPEVAATTESAPEDASGRSTSGSLVATSVVRRFGGIAAVHDTSIEVQPREIVGIIGANGAGKSTLLDCLSGRQAADAGRIELNGQDVSGWSATQRARVDLARTFQDAALYPGLTVREAVLVAVERTNPTGAFSAAFGTPWSLLAEREKRVAVDAALARTGLLEYADRPTDELSTGMRRLCELASALVASPSIIFLDEPTTGLSQREVEAFGPRLRALRDVEGATLLIVEHDIPLLVSLCDRLYCMELGTVIAEGTPQEVIADPAVIASCLGGDPDAIARSGSARTHTTRRTKKVQTP